MSEGQALVGATIAGKYRIRRLIGVGGMGSVYEGQHVDLAKRVAIKIIDSAAVMSSELTTRFKREARAASAVESDGIVQVFDVGRDPEVGLYMVMEFLQGEDLEMRLRKQPGRRLDPVIVAHIGYQVARALAKAHGARVIHRDLKPANIFLTEKDDGALRVKVLDFGISKLLSSEASIATGKEGMLDLTQAGVALGTPQYMSPEQAQGLTTVDHRTDVWGLGVVLYEALTGVPAYPELKSYQDTIMKILTERPPPLEKVAPWVPAEFAKVVHEAVEHDPDRRIPDCATFASRIASAVPELSMGSSGPFTAVSALARSGSRPGFVMPASLQTAARPGTEPSMRPATEPSAQRPITLGDDTQVVVRPSDPSAAFNDDDPSTTMLAEGSPSTRRDPAKVVVRDSGGQPAPASAPADSNPTSSADPTMFQRPAWVEPTADRPTTKSGMAVMDVDAHPGRSGTRPLHGVLAAALTALVIIGLGLGVFAITQHGPLTVRPPVVGATTPGLAAASAAGAPGETPGAMFDETAGAPAELPSASARDEFAAPPATGTGAAPMAPATGAASLGLQQPPRAAAKDAGTSVSDAR